jgi:hypothetical protein
MTNMGAVVLVTLKSLCTRVAQVLLSAISQPTPLLDRRPAGKPKSVLTYGTVLVSNFVKAQAQVEALGLPLQDSVLSLNDIPSQQSLLTAQRQCHSVSLTSTAWTAAALGS